MRRDNEPLAEFYDRLERKVYRDLLVVLVLILVLALIVSLT